MSVHTDARTAEQRLAAAPLARTRVGSLALDIVLVAGVSLLLGLIRLGDPSLWYDEAYSYRQINRSYLEQFEGYQPFYYWIQKPWTTLAGTSEWAMRVPSVVGAMLAAALVVVLARKLFDRRVALLSGLFLAASPYIVKWSQQARAYTLLVVLGLVATLLLLRALDRPSRGSWALYGVAYVVLMVTHAVAGLLLVPAHAVLIAQRRERVLPHGLLALVIVVAVGLPWIGQLAIRTDGDTSDTAWIPFPSAEYAGRSLLALSGAAGLGILLAALGLWLLRRAGDGRLAVWLATWAFGPFVVALVISLARPVFVDRYLAIAAPAFAMLSAVGVLGLTGRLRAGIAVAAATATAVGLVAWYQTPEEGNWRGEDWRSAVAAVSARSDDAGTVVVVPWWAHDAADYYGARTTSVSTADSIWVLHWSEQGAEIPAAVRRRLGFGDHERVETTQFGWRLTAQLWQRRS